MEEYFSRYYSVFPKCIFQLTYFSVAEVSWISLAEPLPTQSTSLYPTFNPPYTPLYCFFWLFILGSLTSEPANFLTPLLYYQQMLTPTWLHAPWAVITQEVLMLGFLILDGAAAAAKLLQSCPTLRNPMDYSPPCSSVHGIFQAKVPEWGAIAFFS